MKSPGSQLLVPPVPPPASCKVLAVKQRRALQELRWAHNVGPGKTQIQPKPRVWTSGSHTLESICSLGNFVPSHLSLNTNTTVLHGEMEMGERREERSGRLLSPRAW